MELPIEVKEVINRLEDAGEEAYVVGGAVRDYLLQREVNDYDIATTSTPDKTERIFSQFKTIDIGKKYGTILVINRSREIEVTSFRKDGVYSDGRRPDKVKFSRNLKDDLERRDFTINALCYSDKLGYLDYFNGRKDLADKTIRAIGDPNERFREDYLRILRAIRFSSQLGFSIENISWKACIENRKGLLRVSRERIRDEFFKILLSDQPSLGIKRLKEAKILGLLFPEIEDMIGFDQDSPYHDKDLYNHSLRTLDLSPKDLSIRLAALFHDIGKLKTKTFDEDGFGRFYGHNKIGAEITRNILSSFNSPKSLIKEVCLLIDSHMINNKDFKKKGIKKLIRKHGEEGVYKLLELQKADRRASGVRARDISDILDMERKIGYILDTSQVYEEKQLAIDGKDVIELGYNQGKLIGDILKYALDIVLEDESLNKKDLLLKRIDKKFKDRREL